MAVPLRQGARERQLIVVDGLSNKVALVTGASRGIGRAISRDLAAAGVRVVGTARPSPDLAQLAGELRDAPTPGFVVPADLRVGAAVAALFAEIERRTNSLDIVVNNAGIAYSGRFVDTPLDVWHAILATNVAATLAVTQMAVRRMLDQHSGHILFIASDAALCPIPHMAPYCASKSAILGFARALAAELQGQGIRITTIMPGGVNTTILAAQANRCDVLQPEDIATTVRWALTQPSRAEVNEILLTSPVR